jgi:signal recognition particle receptor subunit alpha
MLHLCTVFTKGGAVLWDTQNEVIRGSPINAFIQQVLLQDKAGALKSFDYGEYTLKWTFHNDLNLIFVALYVNFSSMFDVDAFLLDLKEEFLRLFSDAFKVVGSSTVPLIENFDQFNKSYSKIESKYVEMVRNGGRRASQGKVPRTYQEKMGGEKTTGKGVAKNGNRAVEVKEEKKGDSDHDADAEAESGNLSEEVSGEEHAAGGGRNRKSVDIKSKIKGRGSVGKISKKASAKKVVEEEPVKGKKPKEKRDWSRPAGVSSVNSEDLDKSKDRPEEEEEQTVVIERRVSEDEYESNDEDKEDELEANAPKKSSGVFGFFSGLMGGRALTKEDLVKPLENIRENLLAKNVATEIVDKIVSGVSESLVGKTIPPFTTFKSVVKTAMEETLTRILTPKRNIDIVREALEAKEQGRPYSIVFVGVNGVGKSTSLSKICYYLLARDLKVSIAACDTFRAGAVEQLKTHARRLGGVEVFEQGYNKDASAVAAEGIKQAKRRGDDVILIDTAGRMQDNEPLMRALSKLIVQNNPDLVLFVGEALVGNDAVDQLVKFNRALTDLSTSSEPRLIDGIVLTKFDTVDDKVGSSISMTYTTGQPIVFVGVGQDYGDIRRLSVKTLVHKLLK